MGKMTERDAIRILNGIDINNAIGAIIDSEPYKILETSQKRFELALIKSILKWREQEISVSKFLSKLVPFLEDLFEALQTPLDVFKAQVAAPSVMEVLDPEKELSPGLRRFDEFFGPYIQALGLEDDEGGVEESELVEFKYVKRIVKKYERFLRSDYATEYGLCKAKVDGSFHCTTAGSIKTDLNKFRQIFHKFI